MNIRSIDLQVLLPRTTDASKVQQHHDQQAALQQQQFADQWQQISTTRQQQIQGTLKSEHKRVRRDKGEQGDRGGNKEKESRDGSGHSSPENNDPFRGKRIDITT